MNTILEESISLYKQGLSMPKVRKITGISYYKLHGELVKLGINRSRAEAARKYNINHSSATTTDQLYHYFSFSVVPILSTTLISS